MNKAEKKLEFFFDCSSPWTYLAFKEIEELNNRLNMVLVWKPILVGGIFNTINPSVYESRSNPIESKANYSQKDLKDWSKVRNIKINWPTIFPVNSVKVMRGVFYAIERKNESKYIDKVFEAYWKDGKDISSDKVISEIIESFDWINEDFFNYINRDTTKEALKNNTQELIERGGFGSPTIFIENNNMFFGNDRLNLIESLFKNENLFKKS
mgnify:CR=1 FL=1